MEAAGGCVAVHLAIHIPDHRLNDFSTRLLKWVEVVTGGIAT
jgi:hypothetical protein